MKGMCNPIYEHLIKEIMGEQANMQGDTAFVVVNSFDPENEEVEDIMNERRIRAEVFEIDRLKQQQRAEYLNCFKKLYSCEELPMVFMKDQFVGGVQGLQDYFKNMDKAGTMLS